MKTKSSIINVMKALCLLWVICCFSSCNYSEKTLIEFNQMKKPVILYDKQKNTFWYSVTLKDGNNDLHKFGNMSSVANWMGDNFQVGDTIRK